LSIINIKKNFDELKDFIEEQEIELNEDILEEFLKLEIIQESIQVTFQKYKNDILTGNIDARIEPNATDLAVKDLKEQGYTVKCVLDTYPDKYWNKLVIDWNLKKEN
jgi:hypothetical protein